MDAPALLPVQLDTTHLIALAAALGWASGLRLYAVVFFTGMAGWLGWVPLPPGLQVLQHPAVLVAAGALLLIEFLADKIPAIDSVWDGLHTLIRIPAGAALAAGVFSGLGGDLLGADPAVWATVAALLGGTLAATSHVAKATTRAAINTSPEPFSNIGASLLGDAAVPVMLWLAWTQPAVFFACLAVALVVMAVLIVVLMKFLRGLLQRLRGWMRPSPGAPA